MNAGFSMDEFYVIFKNSDYLPFSLLNKGFQHCCIIKVMGDKAVYIDHTSWGTGIAIRDTKEVQFVMAGLAKETVVLHNPQWLSCPTKQPLLNTCVNRVKAELGFSSKAVTPYQLYKDLLKEGFVELGRELDNE